MPQICEAPRKGGASRESWPASREFLTPETWRIQAVPPLGSIVRRHWWRPFEDLAA